MSDDTVETSVRGGLVVLAFGTLALFAISAGGGCLKSPDGGEIESWSGADRSSDAGSTGEKGSEGGSASGGSGFFDVGAGAGGGAGGGTPVDARFGSGSDSEESLPGARPDGGGETGNRGSDGGEVVDSGECVGDTCPAPCPDVGEERDADVSSDASAQDVGSADVETEADGGDVRCR